ncbi:MAG TPA: glycosyltransferase family 2 protein [Erysipelotrichaceae bacterium]|nr:glycosyltransferase family 2 protein [Erysipelotrichaceae bacterium]
MGNNNHSRNDTFILIPSYQPDEQLIRLLINLKNENFDIVVVDDGSSIEHQKIFKEAEEYAVVLKHEVNRGKGAALRFGLSYINLYKENHIYVITCDDDGQHAVEDVLKVSDKLYETDNVVFGCRNFKEDMPRRSRNGNFMSRLFRTMLTKEYIQDDQCGLRGFPIRDIFNLIPLQGNSYDYEMNVVCNLQIKRIKIEEVPIKTIYIDDNASSHFRPGLDTFKIQRMIWSIAVAPLICGLSSIFLMVFLNINFDRTGLFNYLFLFVSYVFYFYLLMGVTSFLWPTRKMGRRILIEGIYASIKTVLIFGLFAVFFSLLHWYAPIAYAICLLISFLINFPLAYIAWKIKNGKRKRKKKD